MRLFLIRHAESEANLNGILAGRLPNIGLSPKGMVQAKDLAERLSSIEWSTIYSSPIQRCVDTATISVPQLSHIKTLPELSEIDYGEWSGQEIQNLQKLELWHSVQNSPALIRFPNGESFVEAQMRAKASLQRIAEFNNNDANIVFFTHADMIKIFIVELLELPLADFQKFIIDTASVTVFQIDKSGNRLSKMNSTTGNLES